MSALAIGLLAALCWGIHDLCVRWMSRQADIAACLVVVLFAGLMFQVPALALPINSTSNSATSSAISMMGVAFSAMAGVFFFVASYALYRAFAAGPVRIVAPIVAAYPIVTLPITSINGSPISTVKWIAVLIIIVGVALVASRSASEHGVFNRFKTIYWSIAAAISYALTFALGQALSSTEPFAATLLITRSGAIVTVMIFMLLSGGLRWPPKSDWSMLILMGFLDAAALGLVFAGGLLANGALATVTASLFGVITILLASIFLKERLVSRQWLGVIITFSAIGFLASS